MRLRVILFGLALSLAGGARAAEIAVADPQALAAALARAAPGDVIALAPGRYGDLLIAGRRGKGALDLAAADPASPPVFRSIFLRDSERVTLRGLAVAYGPASRPLSDRAVEIRRADAVRIEGLRISSAANADAADDATGLVIRDSRDVTVLGSRFADLFRGVAIYDSDRVRLDGNAFSRIGADGVGARGTRDLTVENNSFTDFTPADPARWHPDAVQLWSRGAARAHERVRIRGNLVRRGAGAPTQGVFVKTPEIASRDVLIENNRIEQSMGQGVFAQNVVGVTIRNNILVAVEPLLHPPAIEVREPFEGAVVVDNEAPKFRLPFGVDARRNHRRQ